MSRTLAAQLAKFRRTHPLWQVRQDRDGSFIATRGTTLIASGSLDRLAMLADRAGPPRGEDDD